MKTFLTAFLFLSTAALGQSLTIGVTYGGNPNSSDSAVSATRTDVSLLPATANGSIQAVHLYWSTPDCSNAIKIKFFHRVANTLTLFDERGPLTSNSAGFYTMAPAVGVQQGDLIGVARVANCGNAGTLAGGAGVGYLVFPGELTGSVDITTGTSEGAPLFLFGTGTATSSTARVMTVAGSLAGAFGSQFRTQLQLFNTGASSINGRLVFHSAGTSGTSTDLSIPYSLAAGQLIYYSDIVAGIGQSGLGSIDFVVPAGQNPPLAVTRVYNDAGFAGTTGLTEDLVTTSSDNRVISQGSTGFLIAPPDPAKARFNIGIRTLDMGATITAILKDGTTGATLATVTKSYQPNWFEQSAAASFFNVSIVGPSAIVQISVSAGSAIIYGSSTDNLTNDPSVQFMTNAPAAP